MEMLFDLSELKNTWNNPFIRLLKKHNLDIPPCLFASTLAGQIEKSEELKPSELMKLKTHRLKMMREKYKFPQEIINLFERLYEEYTMKDVPMLRNYYDKNECPQDVCAYLNKYKTKEKR